MRIDPKYFNHFMVILAVICIAVITITSIRYIGKQEERFLNRLDGQKLSDLTFLSTKGDTLQLKMDQTTVLLFWATWSDRSMEALYDLYSWHDQNPSVEVISSFVKDSGEFAEAHDRKDKAQFIMVNGTPAYQDLRVPGIPTVIIFDSLGVIHTVEVGTKDEAAWHSLTTGGQQQP